MREESHPYIEHYHMKIITKTFAILIANQYVHERCYLIAPPPPPKGVTSLQPHPPKECLFNCKCPPHVSGQTHCCYDVSIFSMDLSQCPQLLTAGKYFQKLWGIKWNKLLLFICVHIPLHHEA